MQSQQIYEPQELIPGDNQFIPCRSTRKQQPYTIQPTKLKPKADLLSLNIDNFYRNDRLDVDSLKTRLGQIKQKKQQQHSMFENKGRDLSSLPSRDESQAIASEPRNLATAFHGTRPKERVPIHRPRVVDNANFFPTSTNNSKPSNSNTSFNALSVHEKVALSSNFAIRAKQTRNQSRCQKQREHINESQMKKTQSRSIHWDNPQSKQRSRENKFKCTQGEYQKIILALWSHYQLLSGIVSTMRENPEKQKNAIVKYVQDVCSNKFQFIEEYLKKIAPDHYLQKLFRVILSSRLLENISILHLSLFICRRNAVQTDLVNYLGYGTSNLVFLIKVFSLSYLQENISQSVEYVFSLIRSFQLESYMGEITQLKEIAVRMDHNNDIMLKIQHKITSKMDKQFQQNLNNFLKQAHKQSFVLIEQGENISLNQRNRHIFEYLSYYLHHSNQVLSTFPFVEMPPTPYLTLPLPYTIFIEPMNVLISASKGSYFIRAYTEFFLNTLQPYFNIVFYTQAMPVEAESWKQYLPSYPILYRYHCKLQDKIPIKMLWRTGCDLKKSFIIDCEEAHFKYDQGLVMMWKGKKNDDHLVNLAQSLVQASKRDDFLGCIHGIKQQIKHKKVNYRVIKKRWVENPVYHNSRERKITNLRQKYQGRVMNTMGEEEQFQNNYID